MDFSPTTDTVLLTARRLSHEHWNPDRQARWSSAELARRLNDEVADGNWTNRIRPSCGPLSVLIDAGEVQQWPGRSSTEYQAVLPMNLGEILAKAEERQDPNLSVRPGAIGSDPKERLLHHLTPTQWTKAQTAARKLGIHFNPDDPDAGMETVGREYLAWDRDGGKSQRGDWTRALQLLKRACAEQGIKEKTTETYKGSLRRLLDLAATREWLPRTDLHNPEWEPIPPEWSDIYEDWHAVATDAGAPKVRRALLTLFRRLSAIGVENPRRTPWAEVIPQLEAHFSAVSMRAPDRSHIRRLYRELRAAGTVEGPEWNPLKQRIANSPALVRDADCREVGDLYGRDGHRVAVRAALKGTDHPWPKRWRHIEGLVEGVYGLRAWALQAGTNLAEQEKLGLPERPGKPQRPGTMHRKLWVIAKACGVVANRFGVDWSDADLRVLYRPDHLRAYYEHIRTETNASASSNQHRVIQLGTVVGDFLLPLAKQRQESALIERFRYAYDLVYGEGADGRSSWKDRLATEAFDSSGATQAERMKAKSLLVERTWTKNKQVAAFAYDQMQMIGHKALCLLKEKYGPLEVQLNTIADGRSTSREGRRGTLDRRWAKEIRDVLLWWDQLVVPYRTRTLAQMDLQDRIHSEDYRQISAAVHKSKRKAPNAEWHRPNYRKDANSPYPAKLYRLYRCAGGARERLLTRANGVRWTPDPSNDAHRRKPAEGGGLREPFYANRLTESTYARMRNNSVRKAVRRVAELVLARWPDALGGVTYGALMEPDGVLAPHAFRHALAKRALTAPGLARGDREGVHLDAVCQVLDHSDRSMLWEVYAGTSEADYDIGSITRNTAAAQRNLSEAEQSQSSSDMALELLQGLPSKQRADVVARLLSDAS